ncbi:hypothetical protein T07_4047 [Trichinella nelsoni]|uniref:Uncharacterized protein n=1 Tax=Trichinella nelsoni TaxID=6336 RepID=A0A0V0RXD4_9BILA|nr:hypothetical protein T07_4047 [Trichinella nelsoni]
MSHFPPFAQHLDGYVYRRIALSRLTLVDCVCVCVFKATIAAAVIVLSSETPLAGLLTSDGCQYETAAIYARFEQQQLKNFWSCFRISNTDSQSSCHTGASLWNINIVRIVQFVHPESSTQSAQFYKPVSGTNLFIILRRRRQVGAKPAPSAGGAARPYNKSTNNGAEKSQPNGGTGHR